MDTAQTLNTPPWPDCLAGCFVYHAAPLHYVPSILGDGRLVSKLIGAGLGIAPRASAVRRDRMLGLAKYVHFGFELLSPLVKDKIAKGYPHAVFVFPAVTIARLRGAALLPYNTKAWKSRAAVRPIVDACEMQATWRLHSRHGRLPSVEMLVPFAVGLEPALEVVFFNEDECAAIRELAAAVGLSMPPARTGACPRTEFWPVSRPECPARVFLDRCRRECAVLPAPNIAFD